MIKKLLHNLSFNVIRTNPKLTTNVKILVDSNDKLYLESFDANNELSKKSFKGFKINPMSSYEIDLYNFYNRGKFPKELAYEVYQGFDDTKILSKFSNQYEMFYNAGAEIITSQIYSEGMGIFSPLWLNKEIPKYFVIFKINDPVSVNNKNAITENINTSIVEDKTKFIEHILAKSTIIKTIDLTEQSNIGKYIRNYFNKSSFPKSSLTFTSDKNESTTWNGISYTNGGFVSKGEFIYDKIISQDKSIIEHDYFFTKGFERNGVISANLLNLEFLFDDETSDYYELNRYFGLYVNDLEEGNFLLNGRSFYINAGIESSQNPLPPRIDSIKVDNDDNFIINNDKGVLLYIDKDSVDTITGLPDKTTVSNLPSIFYIKDKNCDFRMIKTGSHWKENELRISDKSINLKCLKGFKEPLTFSTAKILEEKGKSHCMFTINGTNIPHGFSIEFLDGDISIGKVQCNQFFTEAGKAKNRFFSNTGNIEEVVESIKSAINNIENKMFTASTVDNKHIVVAANFSGSRFNKLNFKLDEILLGDYITYYPGNNLTRNNFVGGTDNKEYRIKVSSKDIMRFNTDRYVKTTTGFNKIKDIVLYLDNTIRNTKQQVVGYREINDYKVVIIENAKPYLDSLKQVSLYELFKPSFGRLSMFPIKDFDFDFFSEEYNDLGELETEYNEYNRNTYNDINKASNPDISEFYKKGFSKLHGLFKEESSDTLNKLEIFNEYDRLKENYILELSTISRVVPYINKWVYKDGKDVRNKDYRLNTSPAFGLYNFSPSSDNYSQDSDSFTHEWYYLSKYPLYYVEEDFKTNWSYFDEKVWDNKESVLDDSFEPGFFQDTTVDNFTNYFVKDRFNFNNKWIVTDKQIRYTLFDYGNENIFSETFFRGIKVRIKQRSDFNLSDENKAVINYNLQNINYIKNTKFNGYKFAAIMVPHHNSDPEQDQKPSFSIKFVENQKWKTITMIIFIDINYEYFDGGREFIDRTLLYALQNNLMPDTDGIFSSTNYNYADTEMQGSIDFVNSTGFAPGPYVIKGFGNIYNVPTNFLQDIKLNEIGKYPKIYFTADGPGGGNFEINGITRIVNKDTLYANYITRNGQSNITFPTTLPTSIFLKESNYYVENGGYLIYKDITRNVSFANIYEKINQGDPSVIYETIHEDGSRNYNEFIVELQSANRIMKPTYINTIVDENRPVAFNLTNIIGYRFILNEKIYVGPYFRHSGKYDPKFKDIIKFGDPYLDKGTPEIDTATEQLTEYEEKVLNNLRFTNSKFILDDNFGVIKNLYYHKVNESNPDNILELSPKGAFKSVYPLINETGINKKDFYIFKSNWDSSYYINQQSKNEQNDVIGTRNMKEHKSFFGSKIMTIPNKITIDTFDILDGDSLTNADKENLNKDIYYYENINTVKLEVNIEKKLTKYLYDKLYNLFVKYIKPEFSIGDKTIIDDDIKEYIKTNILNRYKINSITLFTLKYKSDDLTSYEFMNSSDYLKLENGLSVDKIFNTEFIINSNLNFNLIYNKIVNYSYKFGLSIDIIKK